MQRHRPVWIEHWPFFRGFHGALYELDVLGILACYQHPDEDTQRDALSRRRAVRIASSN